MTEDVNGNGNISVVAWLPCLLPVSYFTPTFTPTLSICTAKERLFLRKEKEIKEKALGMITSPSTVLRVGSLPRLSRAYASSSSTLVLFPRPLPLPSSSG